MLGLKKTQHVHLTISFAGPPLYVYTRQFKVCISYG